MSIKTGQEENQQVLLQMGEALKVKEAENPRRRFVYSSDLV